VDAGGGFIYSQKAGNTLTILPRYQKGYWDTMTVDDHDILLSESLVMQQNIKRNDEYIADFNAITVVNSRSGESLKVQQRSTSGDVLRCCTFRLSPLRLFTTVMALKYS